MSLQIQLWLHWIEIYKKVILRFKKSSDIFIGNPTQVNIKLFI